MICEDLGYMILYNRSGRSVILTHDETIDPGLENRIEFKTNVDRVSHRELLKKEIEDALKNKTTGS